MSTKLNSKQKRAIKELIGIAFKPTIGKVNKKLDRYKIDNLKRETEISRQILHDERYCLRMPVTNMKAQEKKVMALNTRHKALRNELKRLIRAQQGYNKSNLDFDLATDLD